MSEDPKETAYVLKGCNHCAALKKKYAQQIKDGTVKLVDCADNPTDEDLDSCQIIVNRPDFDGFPFLVKGKNGDKVE